MFDPYQVFLLQAKISLFSLLIGGYEVAIFTATPRSMINNVNHQCLLTYFFLELVLCLLNCIDAHCLLSFFLCVWLSASIIA